MNRKARNLARHLAFRYDMLGPTTANKDPENPTRNAHLKWMLEEILAGVEEDKEKFWLGFVYGAVVAKGMATKQEVEHFMNNPFRLTLLNTIGPSSTLDELMGEENYYRPKDPKLRRPLRRKA